MRSCGFRWHSWIQVKQTLMGTHDAQSPVLSCGEQTERRQLPWGDCGSEVEVDSSQLAVSFSLQILYQLSYQGSLVAQTVKRLSTMRETRVRSLGREDPLEKERAIHSSTVAWKIPWTEEPSRLQSMRSQRVGHDWAILLSLSLWLHQVLVFCVMSWGTFHCGTRALKVLGSVAPQACRILVPRPGIEPESPALHGGFSTTGPPGKPSLHVFSPIPRNLWKAEGTRLH